MENQDNPTDTNLSGAAHVDAADGGAAVADTLSLAELNQYLGKDFKDKATALKAVKDTFSFVGKKIETAAPSVQPDPELKAKVQSLEEEVFYANHPEYKDHRDVIKALGGNPAEVVGTDVFKGIFEKAKVADDVQKRQSVLNTNQRIAQAPSLNEDATKKANEVGSSASDVASVFAKQIVEAMGNQG